MREDVLNKKVYFIKSGTNQERLLYDFSLGMNDTVTVFAQDFGFSNTAYKLKVIGIDSIQVNGHYRRRMVMKANGIGFLQEYWIEGIGSNFGVFTPGLSDFFIVDSEVCVELRCFWQNSSLVYSTYSPPVCYTSKTNCFVGLNEWKSRERIIQCFPNPFTDEVILYSNQEETGSLQIKDLLGNTLYSTLMTNSNQNSISLRYLASGFYFIVFRNNDGRILLQEKFLKSE
ncbi:MAG TPA: T9SS type A sorting domain-containing protein [Bacteroidia bacterium]|nr:T9SS type A sorting domain-containing protein [Bacteroidia bacterium]